MSFLKLHRANMLIVEEANNKYYLKYLTSLTRHLSTNYEDLILICQVMSVRENVFDCANIA